MRLSSCPVLILAVLVSSSITLAEQTKRPFTVADDIAFTYFADGPYGNYEGGNAIQFSPNGEYLAVVTAHGRLDLNVVEESVRVYRTKEIAASLEANSEVSQPAPAWVVTCQGKVGPIVEIRWLADSSGIVLLKSSTNGNQQLAVASLRERMVKTLTSDSEDVKTFEASDANHYVYTSADPGAFLKKVQEEEKAPAIVGTGKNIWDMVFPTLPSRLRFESPSTFWAVVGGSQRFAVTNKDIDTSRITLSPDGQWILTTLPITPPVEWKTIYPPPYKGAAGDNLREGKPVRQYLLFNLKTGAVQPLIDAPTAADAGWFSGVGFPTWSNDGKAVLLPGTFVKSKGEKQSRPCIAVVDVPTKTSSCVEPLKSRTGPGLAFEQGYHILLHARFVGAGNNRVELAVMRPDESDATSEYVRATGGDWQLLDKLDGKHYAGPNGLDITVEERLDRPPLLVASSHGKSRSILDPNPHFREIDLGWVRVYTWKDKEGRSWKGGLYLPAGYQKGRLYPLVIQSHGFRETLFLPSGAFTTSYAAREFAASGIMVLQAGGSEYCGASGPDEGPCEVEGFEAAATQLAADGLVDLQKVGFIGFSRTCYYGMEWLTNGSLPLGAALIADGAMGDYFQFVLAEADSHEFFGVTPFGAGLSEWVKRSPGFHLDKVSAPVMLVGERDGIDMWQPYSGLHYLKKPVDTVWINTFEHSITNPVARLASQTLSVDWFRFWLQGYEDPDPAKAEQYKRWHELKKMQEENEKKLANESSGLSH